MHSSSLDGTWHSNQLANECNAKVDADIESQLCLHTTDHNYTTCHTVEDAKNVTFRANKTT